MSQEVELLLSCHCGAARQTVVLRSSDIDLCHCHACRHGTGLLCVSYASIQAPPSLAGLVSHHVGSSSAHASLHRYFCDTCGCHVFRHEKRLPPAEGEGEGEDEGEEWGVATGVIVGRADADAAGSVTRTGDEEAEPLLRFVRHVNTASTKDGGLSPFISHVEGSELEVRENGSAPSTGEREIDGDDGGVLEAHCHCDAIRFHITRPDASSRLPHSGFPDLTVPFATTPREIAANPHDEKWWLRPPGRANPTPTPTRYLAGTCACRSCRLASGFEVQTWAFVPRSNLFFHPPLPSAPPPLVDSPSPASQPIPLDFAALAQRGIPLKSYASSPGVRREFCARCGATVFWHDRWRPDLVDVSVGLLDAGEGARAEGWLQWWCGRVSFEEEVGNGRTGEVARVAKSLIRSLAEGLGRWEDGKVDGTVDG
ncbi:hypothetical protein F4818DRAFT_199944 [Hypoxylon cercidicola]|nr:hypothetical protein F4818DRAFT_199944 [Hypoxylon cercidicola]